MNDKKEEKDELQTVGKERKCKDSAVYRKTHKVAYMRKIISEKARTLKKLCQSKGGYQKQTPLTVRTNNDTKESYETQKFTMNTSYT